ncbi:MAG: hypothetical protein ACOY0T_31310 [Myxococcota bacterium]
MLPYVPIVRHFRDVADEPKDGFTRQMFGAFDRPVTWADILTPAAGAPHAIVLVAASGTGKTADVQHLVQQLREAGEFALYCDAGAVAANGLRDSLAGVDVDLFEMWLKGTSRGTFAIDGVDEVYLRSCTFRDLTRRLAKEIDIATRDVQLVVTTRTGAWLADDRKELENLLRARTKSPNVRTVTFEPIDTVALRALASAGGAERIDDFVRQFEEDELNALVDLRPRDVEMFVDYWNTHGAFGTWSEMLEAFLGRTFIEQNPLHAAKQRLSLEQRSAGLQRVAAAATFSKQPHITLPSAMRVSSANDGQRLFADWEPNLRQELFASPLFVHKGETAVQLPQGGLSDFLTSMWLKNRAQFARGVRELLSALCVKVFDDGSWRVPTSRWATVGWAASAMPSLRKVLLETEPHLVLYEGDPSRLSGAEVADALRRVIGSSPTKGLPWPTPGTVRRLASPELENEVLSLLREHRGNDKVQSHLLQYVRLGRYSACIPHAIDLAFDISAAATARARAIKVITSIGDGAQKQKLLALVHEDSEEIRAELSLLIPDYLRAEQLVNFLMQVGSRQLRYSVERQANLVNTLDLDRVLQRLNVLLSAAPVGPDAEEPFSLAIVLLAARLRRATTDTAPAWLGNLVFEIERQWDEHYVSESLAAELQALLKSHAPVRRLVWEARIARAAEVPAAIWRPRVGIVEPDDVSFLFEQHKLATEDVLKHQLLWAIDGCYNSLSEAARESLRMRPDMPAELLELFRKLEDNYKDRDRASAARMDAERIKKMERREQNIRSLLGKEQEIESGSHLGLLEWAWQNLLEPDTAKGRINVGELEELVGEELSASFAIGFKACWRKQRVPLPVPGEKGTLYVLLAGLTGLTLDIRDGLHLSSLTNAEAELAARYALLEMNSFPYWFEDLLAARPATVRQVLEDVLRSEWTASCEHHGIMRFASHASPKVASVMRSVVLGLLETVPNEHPIILRAAAGALLTSTDEGPRIARAVRARLGAAEAAEAPTELLRVWAHFEPIEAADWLESVRLKSATDFDSLTHRLAEVLGYDLESDTKPLTPLTTPRSLERWIKLLDAAVRPTSDESKRTSFDLPDARDDAQDLCRRLVKRLAQNPSVDAYSALGRLRADSALGPHLRLDDAAEQQLARAVENAAAPWTESDILAVEGGDDRRPRSLQGVFALVERHLARVAELVENDDFSYRDLFTESTREREIQLWVASTLKLVAGDFYSVVRESTVDDDKEVDIHAFADGLGRVPIEIKPLGPYSFNQLEECIRDQLYGKYMKPEAVRYGFLLAVRHTMKRWEVDDRLVGFRDLIDALQTFAREFGARHDKIIKVVTIDMLADGP